MRFLEKNNIGYEKAGSGINIGLIIGIAGGALVVLGGAAVLVILLTKKKSSPAAAAANNNVQAVANQQPAAQTAVKKGVARSLSIQHGGRAFPVGKATIMIGRDAATCSIAFAANTPGVSSRHCSLSYDSATQEFTLTDLKSTYGTYILATNQKLEPNIPFKLRAGQSFCVGDKANVITVELVD